MRLEEQHYIFYFFLFNPAFFNQLQPFRAYAWDFGKLVGLFVKNVKGFRPESIDNFSGINRADAFYQTAAEIFMDSFNCYWQSLLAFIKNELKAVFRVVLPFAVKIKNRTGVNLRHCPDSGKNIPVAFRGDFDDAPAVLLIVVRYSFYDAV